MSQDSDVDFLVELDQPWGSRIGSPELPVPKEHKTHFSDGSPVTISLGGVLWELPWHIHESIRDILPEKILVAYESNGQAPPDYLRTETVHIVSNRLKELIAPFLINGEFIPITLVDVDHKVCESTQYKLIEGFWRLNIWNRLDIIDWEKSTLNIRQNDSPGPYPDSPIRASNWTELTLRVETGQAYDIFILKYVYGNRMYLSPRVVDLIVHNSMDVRFKASALRAGGDSASRTTAMNAFRGWK